MHLSVNYRRNLPRLQNARIPILSVGGARGQTMAAKANPIKEEIIMSANCTKSNNAHLHRFVKDAAANLDHLQVLFLFVPGALDVSHPAALVLLAGIDEAAHRSILVEHLTARDKRSGLFRRQHQTTNREMSPGFKAMGSPPTSGCYSSADPHAPGTGLCR